MDVKKSWKYTLVWVSFFSIAAGFLESAVVIYLRKIYYPYGFGFPLTPMENAIASVEFLRELATLIILVSVGYIAGQSFKLRFAYFLYCFAVWDIFYYVFLYLLIGWPESLLTWDILFLIPVTWVGPVIAPVIVSLTMIAIAFLILINDGRNKKLSLNAFIWSLLISGSLLIFGSFIWDYSAFILEHHHFKDLWNLSENEALFDTAYSYMPRKFNWLLFMLGEMIILSTVLIIGFRKKSD